jgi:hypothetical protein
MQRQAIALAFSVILLLPGSSVLATQVLHRTPAQLGQQSTLVVRGRVTNVESYWNTSRTKIFTRTSVAIDETYKGRPVGAVTVVQMGGVVDGVRVTVAGALAWRQGEEVVLFLEPYEAGSFHIAGFSQGKFEVERDPDSGEPFVRQPAVDGVEYMRISPTGDNVPAQVSVTTKMPIAQFINRALGTSR